MTHEERAKKFFDDAGSDALPSIEAALAEQFREVGKLAVAVTLAECEKSHAEEMRSVVRAGDALRYTRYGKSREARAWDAATKGIER